MCILHRNLTYCKQYCAFNIRFCSLRCRNPLFGSKCVTNWLDNIFGLYSYLRVYFRWKTKPNNSFTTHGWCRSTPMCLSVCTFLLIANLDRMSTHRQSQCQKIDDWVVPKVRKVFLHPRISASQYLTYQFVNVNIVIRQIIIH